MAKQKNKWNLDALAKAREIVRLKAPYFATGIYRLKPVQCEGVPTMGVDSNLRLYYNPSFISKTKPFELASVLVHELLHILDRHHARANQMGVCDQKSAHLWNIAADIALHPLLVAGDWKISNHLKASMFGFPSGRTVEEYYRMLQKEKPDTPKEVCMSPGHGTCGSCATGIQEPWEQEQEPHSSVADQEVLRSSVSRAIEAHQKSAGSIPGSYQIFSDYEFTKPKIRWQSIFSSAVRSGVHGPGKVDFSRSRPSRRQQSTPKVIRPALVQPYPHVAVVVDTSGSMDDSDLAEAMSEVKGILRAAGVSEGVTVLPCDTVVYEVQKVWNPKQIKLEGRGGTDMGEGLYAAAKLKQKPSVVVVMTDGGTPWPKRKPVKCPVIILLMGHWKESLDSVPAWAHGIEIEKDEKDAA